MEKICIAAINNGASLFDIQTSEICLAALELQYVKENYVLKQLKEIKIL
jgi:hypothetical protein